MSKDKKTNVKGILEKVEQTNKKELAPNSWNQITKDIECHAHELVL